MREMSRRKKYVSLLLPGLLLFLLSVLFPAGCGTTSTNALTEFALPPHGAYQEIAAGPDGALWFTDPTGKIGHLTVQGQFTEFSVPHPVYTPEGIAGDVSGPVGITTGPDGALWFTDINFDRIGRISVQGQITMFSLPASSFPDAITAGPDGALWFLETGLDQIGRITVQGQITTFPLPAGSFPDAITAGPDDALWFTEIFRNGTVGKIGRISVQGQTTLFPLPAGNDPGAITAGPDGALWFTDRLNANVGEIGRISMRGQITMFPLPAGRAAGGITAGPGGALWLTMGVIELRALEIQGLGRNLWVTAAMTGTDRIPEAAIDRLTVQGKFTTFTLPNPSGGAGEIVAGPGDTLWFADGGKIGRFSLAGLI